MKTIKTKQTYLKYRAMLDENNQARNQWMKENKTNGIPCNIVDTFPHEKFITNDLRSAIETYEFINDPPEKYFLYISEEKRLATTWTGQKLGDVYFGREFRSNMGDKRINITVYAINGKTYFGTFYKSSGDYARVTIKKN